MKICDDVREALGAGWLPTIYRERVRSQRTRSYELNISERQNDAEILHTLLGIELKIGKLRVACPDLSTARYLQIFAQLGCRKLAIPYDITKISVAADALETARQQALLVVAEFSDNESPLTLSRRSSAVITQIRREIEEIGAGEAIPRFNQVTK